MFKRGLKTYKQHNTISTKKLKKTIQQERNQLFPAHIQEFKNGAELLQHQNTISTNTPVNELIQNCGQTVSVALQDDIEGR